MPYIQEIYRENLYKAIEEISNELEDIRIDSPENYYGTLNFIISEICGKIIKQSKTYTTMNSVIGVLECAKLEMYRRVVGPYESRKIMENKDIPSYETINK